MHNELRSLIGKYEEMAKRIRASSSINRMLCCTNLFYNAEMIATPLPSKFKVSQIEMYDRSKDLVEN